MASLLRIYSGYEVTVNGVRYTSEGEAPFELSVTDAFSRGFTLATATNRVVLRVGSGTTDNVAAFNYFRLVSDQLLSVELIGTAATANSNMQALAGVPFILTGDDTRAYNAAGGFAGAVQAITSITVRNDSGSTANFRIFVTVP